LRPVGSRVRGPTPVTRPRAIDVLAPGAKGAPGFSRPDDRRSTVACRPGCTSMSRRMDQRTRSRMARGRPPLSRRRRIADRDRPGATARRSPRSSQHATQRRVLLGERLQRRPISYRPSMPERIREAPLAMSPPRGLMIGGMVDSRRAGPGGAIDERSGFRDEDLDSSGGWSDSRITDRSEHWERSGQAGRDALGWLRTEKRAL